MGNAIRTTRAGRREARENVRARLIDFACAIDVPGRPASEDADEPRFENVETALAPHHRLLLETIEAAVERPHGRAMILMPPGSAKSTYCSVVLPTFLMGRDPGIAHHPRVLRHRSGAQAWAARARDRALGASTEQLFGTTLEPRAKRRRRLGAHQRFRIYGDRHPRRP